MSARGRNNPRCRAVSFERVAPGGRSLEAGGYPRRRCAEVLEACGRAIREMYAEATGEDPGLSPSFDTADTRYAAACQLRRI